MTDAREVLAEADQPIADASDLLLEVSAVARRMNVSTWTVRRWIKQKKVIAVITPSNGYRVPHSELVRILADRTCNRCIKSTR